MPLLSRRDWLRSSVAATAFASTGNAAEPVKRGTSFGFSLYGMKTLPIPDALKTCAAIGYDSVEFALMPGWPTDSAKLTPANRKDLRNQLADHKLSLAGLMENLPVTGDDAAFHRTVERLKLACDLAQELSPRSVPPIETILGGKPGEWEKVRDLFAARMAIWAKTAEAAKVVVTVKPHVGNAMRTLDGCVWLMKQVNSPWLRLAFDTSHFELQGVPVAEAIEKLIPYSAFVHVKDWKGTPAKFEFLLPGDGTTDYPAYFTLLKKANYTGPVVVEVSGLIFNRAGYDPIASAKKCYANLAPAFAKSGLRA